MSQIATIDGVAVHVNDQGVFYCERNGVEIKATSLAALKTKLKNARNDAGGFPFEAWDRDWRMRWRPVTMVGVVKNRSRYYGGNKFQFKDSLEGMHSKAEIPTESQRSAMDEIRVRREAMRARHQEEEDALSAEEKAIHDTFRVATLDQLGNVIWNDGEAAS